MDTLTIFTQTETEYSTKTKTITERETETELDLVNIKPIKFSYQGDRTEGRTNIEPLSQWSVERLSFVHTTIAMNRKYVE